jgi:hypothetical protein
MCGPPVLASLWRDARKGSRVESTYDPHLSLVTPLTPEGCQGCPGEDWRWCYVDEAYV